MAANLNAACNQSVDPPNAAPLPAAQPALTGRPGRPCIEIDWQFLEFALDMRGPTYLDLSGTSLNVHTTLTTPVLTLTNEMLDRTVADILTSFLNFGRHMIVDHLPSQGLHVPEPRVAEAYVWVRRTLAIFGRHIIIHKIYQVAGPNSLVHHDEQHGLIWWKFVIHCFIDGHSHFITGIWHALNAGAHAWADAWNAHQLNITAAADDLGDGNPANYGIGWDAIDNTTLMVHHLIHNPSTTLQGSDSHFGPASGPEHLTEVICNPSGSPLTSAHLACLDSHLAYHCNPTTSDMQECKLVWITALQFCPRSPLPSARNRYQVMSPASSSMSDIQKITRDPFLQSETSSSVKIPTLNEDGSNWVLYKAQFLTTV
ncbi:hypothetical protein NUW54_g2976 [Trametes sanguinea]|uniref:Uncharacterized protein n=2 Tax=Trametes sanguinea TaxID=158606 RepID=A0ACC1Q2N4_9APHY|nr:hypothetical protein NUW54_g9603 [Trametes sanguinea]KAJ3008913.1 hypothetical protein NUW54_g2976 [Trametes sanguinea]